jgi:hypothetical protein
MTTHGEKGQAFVSKDKGMTWKPYKDNSLKVIRPHFSVSEVYNGEYLAVPARPYMNWRQENITLPKPISEVSVYGKRHYYALEDMPKKVQAHFGTLQGLRYHPKSHAWKAEEISYDTNKRIIVRYGVASKAHGDELLPQTFFERPLLKHEGELLYGEYRGQYRMADGRPPIKGILTCMASTDNGRSFKRRGTISADRTGESIRGEGCLAPTTDGRLVCVLRQQDQQLKPIKICWSSDKGTTWTESKDLCEFGVFPCIKLLNNGIMVLSYGRPGVHLRFSLDGTGETWSDPITVVKGDLLKPQADSCGYTNLLALDDNSFLLTYNEMKYRGPSGRTCKAILVRRVTINDNL